VNGIRLAGVYQPGVFLEDHTLRPFKAELRPAPRELGGVEQLVVEAVLLEGGDVAFDVAGADLLKVPFAWGLYSLGPL
jgi:hypothetical protein